MTSRQKDHTVHLYILSIITYLCLLKPLVACYCGNNPIIWFHSLPFFLSNLFVDEQKDSVLPSETWGPATAAFPGTQMVPLHKWGKHYIHIISLSRTQFTQEQNSRSWIQPTCKMIILQKQSYTEEPVKQNKHTVWWLLLLLWLNKSYYWTMIRKPPKRHRPFKTQMFGLCAELVCNWIKSLQSNTLCVLTYLANKRDLIHIGSSGFSFFHFDNAMVGEACVLNSTATAGLSA